MNAAKPAWHMAAMLAGAALAAPAAAQSTTVVEDYCAGIVDRARDARVAWQTASLQQLRGEVAAKIAELEAKDRELRAWIEKHDSMRLAASRALVDIYAKMDADAAAVQLAGIETATATSILRQLSPRQAGAILNVMATERAAALVRAIAAATGEAGAGVKN
jgi:flagellar motility protein MotE (MotC chaperone)